MVAGRPTPATGEGSQAGGEIVIKGCTPENPLLPGATSETCGGNVIDAFTAKLVHYNTETAAPEMDIAESIETSDNQNFTVKLKSGYKFHDGTDVKAKNFVDAWNYTAYGPNGSGRLTTSSPRSRATPTAVRHQHRRRADCEGKAPKAKELSGLKVVDDTTFTIKTTEKVSNLPVRLGYSAFAPLPDSFFADPEGLRGEAGRCRPVQGRPRSAPPRSCSSKFADYSGAQKPQVDKITFRVYQTDAAAYADVVGEQPRLHRQRPAPTSGSTTQYKTDLPDRNLVRESGRWQHRITFSPDGRAAEGQPEAAPGASRWRSTAT